MERLGLRRRLVSLLGGVLLAVPAVAISSPPAGAVGGSEASCALAQRPLSPTNPDLFSPGLYGGSGPGPAPAPGMTDAEIRADLERFLTERFGPGSPRIAEGLGLLDDPTLQAKIPADNLRAGLVSLLGTFAEPVIAAFRDDGFRQSVEFGPTTGGNIAEATGTSASGDVRVTVSDAYQYEDYLINGPLLAHEALHSDDTNSLEEELAAKAVQSLAAMDTLSVRPTAGTAPSFEHVFENAFTLARLNSGRDDRLRLFDSLGSLFPGSLSSESLLTFSEIYTGTWGNPTSGNPLSDSLLSRLAESPSSWAPGGDFGAALSFLDSNHAGFTPGVLVRVARALELDVRECVPVTDLAVSVGSASVVEGDLGQRVVKLPVTLSEPSVSEVSVQVRVSDESASGAKAPGPGVDYKRSGKLATVRFKPSAGTGLTPVRKWVSVPVYGDTAVEGQESFRVELVNPSPGLTVTDGLVSGMILDDEASGLRFGVGDAAVHEGDAGMRTAALTVGLSAPASEEVWVDVTVTGGSASCAKVQRSTPPSGVDCDDLGGVTKTLKFKPSVRTGVTPVSKLFSVKVYPDAVAEGDEKLTVTLSNPRPANQASVLPVAVQRPAGTATIVDYG